jgi:hypothetical protein
MRLTNAAEYRLKAAQCEAEAKRCKDLGAKKALEDEAREWRIMAEQAERHSW